MSTMCSMINLWMPLQHEDQQLVASCCARFQIVKRKFELPHPCILRLYLNDLPIHQVQCPTVAELDDSILCWKYGLMDYWKVRQWIFTTLQVWFSLVSLSFNVKIDCRMMIRNGHDGRLFWMYVSPYVLPQYLSARFHDVNDWADTCLNSPYQVSLDYQGWWPAIANFSIPKCIFFHESITAGDNPCVESILA